MAEGNPKTQILVQSVKNGDKSAAEHLFRIYGDRILRLVRLRMGAELRSKMQSMDIVQDALICALRDLRLFTYTNDGDFLRWISKITENRIRDNIKQIHAGKRDVRKEMSLKHNRDDTSQINMIPNELASTTTPSMIVSRREDLDRLEQALSELKPEYREIIVLTRIEGLSHKEAGKRISKSSEAVRMLLSRAMAALSKVYQA